MNPKASKGLVTLNTKNVTRLPSDDPVKAAVAVSQTVWPATHPKNQPGSVILVPKDNWQIAAASTDYIHHPTNGPVLFYEKNRVPKEILAEIDRLQPKGTDNGTQVVVMGNAGDHVLRSLQSYKVARIDSNEPAEFAKAVDQKYTDASGELPKSVIVGSMDEGAKLFTLPAVNWIAHMPEPLLYVSSKGIPQATREALGKRDKQANIYVLGPTSVIPEAVADELKAYGKVTRISGEDPVSNAIAFAQFKDPDTKFGWGLTSPGHGLDFVSTETPELAIAGAPFAHMGKHAPMIWLLKGQLNETVHEFLMQIKPTFKDDPTVGPYNHAFVLGSLKNISYGTQGMLDDLLEIVPEDGEGHMGNMGH